MLLRAYAALPLGDRTRQWRIALRPSVGLTVPTPDPASAITYKRKSGDVLVRVVPKLGSLAEENVCKLLQLLGDCQTPDWGFAPWTQWGLPSCRSHVL